MSIFADEFSKALPGILLSSIVPPAAAYLSNLRNKRHTDELRAIDICARKVSFLSEWIKAQSLCDPQGLSDVRVQVADELQALKDDLARQLLEAKQLRKERDISMGKSSLFRSLILAYTPLGRFTWLLHLVYWYLLVVGVLGGAFYIVIGDFLGFVGFLVGMSIFLLPINLLAKWSQKRSEGISSRAAKKSMEIIDRSAYVGIA
jgi:hypothetical protein